MFEDRHLIGYHEGKSFIHCLSGGSKLLFFLLVSVSCMLTYDTRLLLLVALASLLCFRVSQIRLKSISFILLFAVFFATLNLVTVYLFAPEYAVELYGQKTILIQGVGSYTVTSQELFYLFNLLLKYFCTIPLAILFLMTTHPSQFASSLNQIGVPYKIAYSVSLTLRYIPDLQEEFYMIKMSQEARGLELSRKAKLSERIKGNIKIIVPLIFSSLSRIETVSTAMELRRFGRYKKRSWYTYQPLTQLDYLVIVLAVAIFILTGGLFVLNGSRFYNPWG